MRTLPKMPLCQEVAVADFLQFFSDYLLPPDIQMSLQRPFFEK